MGIPRGQRGIHKNSTVIFSMTHLYLLIIVDLLSHNNQKSKKKVFIQFKNLYDCLDFRFNFPSEAGTIFHVG